MFSININRRGFLGATTHFQRTHYSRSEWWSYFSLLQRVPVHVLEERMGADLVLAVGAAEPLGRVLRHEAWKWGRGETNELVSHWIIEIISISYFHVSMSSVVQFVHSELFHCWI